MDFSKIELVKDLPISQHEEEIAEKLLHFSNLIVIGETGSGKTTQIPLIILKTLGKVQNFAKGKVAVTEPRRLAATSVATYVASLVGDELGQSVGYKIRFSESKSDSTSVLFMTDGILLREAQIDPLLQEYSVVMVDEAHERNINSDFLIGLLVDVQRKRKEKGLIPLKILVTSATLEKEKFIKFFEKIPDEPLDVVEVPGRLFPVEVNLEKKDVFDFEGRAAELVENICKNKLANSINHTHPGTSQIDKSLIQEKSNNPSNEQTLNLKSSTLYQPTGEVPNRIVGGDILIFMPGKGEIERTKLAIQALPRFEDLNLEIITVHADLPIEEQNRIFKKSDRRKVIIATNIAETSLTVPGVVYVIDSGLIKSMEFDPHSGIKSLITKPHAKKGLEQRKGRAGRIQPGVYFGLYTEKSFAERDEFPMPEILRTSLSQIVLIMKILGIDDIHSFHFIDHPEDTLIDVAINELRRMGALDEFGSITEKGVTMASLPLEPRLANLIIEANKNKCVETICTIASFLELKPVMINQTPEEIFNKSVEERKNSYFEEDQSTQNPKYQRADEVVIRDEELKDLNRNAYDTYSDMLRKQRQLQYKGSDFLTLLKIYNYWKKEGKEPEWAKKNYLSPETLAEATNIREELLSICEQSGIDPIDDGNRDLNYRVEKTFIQAFKYNALAQMPTGFYRNIRSKEKNIRIHNSSVLRDDKPKFALAFEVIEISEIDAAPKLSAKFLHAINDRLMQQFFPDVYKYEMQFEKKRGRDRFNNRNKKMKFRGGKGRRSRRR